MASYSTNIKQEYAIATPNSQLPLSTQTMTGIEPLAARQIFINDISGDTTTSDLRNLFAAAGKVTNVEIDTNELNRHFAFVTFETSQGVNQAIQKFTTTQLKNTTLVCRKRSQLEQMRQKRMIEARCKLFVGNIPQQMPAAELRREIERLSQRPIADFRHKKGYCFVGYGSPQNAEEAKRNLKNAICGGKSLNAEFKKEDPIRNEPGFIAVLEQAQRTLYVRDIPNHCNADYFKSLFEKHGKVRKFTLPTENRTNKLVGYAFIEYFWKEDCDKALVQTQNLQIDGVKIEIRVSDPPKDKQTKQDQSDRDHHRRGRRDRRDHRGISRDRRDNRGGRDGRRNSRFSRDNRNRSRSRSRSRSRDRRFNNSHHHGGGVYNHAAHSSYNNTANPYSHQQPNPYNRYNAPIAQQPTYGGPPPATVYNTRTPHTVYNPYGVVDPNANTATNTTPTNTASTVPRNTATPTAAPIAASTAYNPNPYGYNYAAYGYPYGVPQTQPTTTTTNANSTNTTTPAAIPATVQQPQTQPQQSYPQYATQQPNYYAHTNPPVAASTANGTASTNQPTNTAQQPQQTTHGATAAYNYYNTVQPNAYAASYYQQQQQQQQQVAATTTRAQPQTQPQPQQPAQQPTYAYPYNRY